MAKSNMIDVNNSLTYSLLLSIIIVTIGNGVYLSKR